MFRPSAKEADTLRSWFQVTKSIFSAAQTDVPTPTRPLGWMILVYLSYQADGSASYADLRKACDVNDAPSLTQVLKPLAGYVESTKLGRKGAARLTKQGWDVIGKIVQGRTAAQ